jgi:uncharacterized ParB-like nuclease family protein
MIKKSLTFPQQLFTGCHRYQVYNWLSRKNLSNIKPKKQLNHYLHNSWYAKNIVTKNG